MRAGYPDVYLTAPGNISLAMESTIHHLTRMEYDRTEMCVFYRQERPYLAMCDRSELELLLDTFGDTLLTTLLARKKVMALETKRRIGEASGTLLAISDDAFCTNKAASELHPIVFRDWDRVAIFLGAERDPFATYTASGHQVIVVAHTAFGKEGYLLTITHPAIKIEIAYDQTGLDPMCNKITVWQGQKDVVRFDRDALRATSNCDSLPVTRVGIFAHIEKTAGVHIIRDAYYYTQLPTGGPHLFLVVV